MASPAPSSSPFSFDVFLNHRPQDTGLGFTGNLYNALTEKGIRTFIEDGNHQTGESISPSILKAIEESMIAIPVFSQDYASSTFCLDELVKITECKKEKGMIILPIFHGIDPSHVRHQTGSYGKALAKHEENFKDKVQNWRNSLNLAANMSGWIFKNESGYQYEYEFIKEMVKEVSNRVNASLPRVSKYPAEYENDFIGSIVEEFSNKNNGGVPLDAESQLPEINLLLGGSDDRVHKRDVEAQVRMWRLAGLVKSVAGLICFALSSSFTRLIRGWNPWKIVLYGVLAIVVSAFILLATQRLFSRRGKFTVIAGFVVFMLTNMFSFYFDKVVSEKPDILSMVSNVIFSLASLSLCRVFQIGSEFGIFTGFQALFAAQLMTIHFWLVFIAALIGFPLFVIHSYLVSMSEGRNGGWKWRSTYSFLFRFPARDL